MWTDRPLKGVENKSVSVVLKCVQLVDCMIMMVMMMMLIVEWAALSSLYCRGLGKKGNGRKIHIVF